MNFFLLINSYILLPYFDFSFASSAAESYAVKLASIPELAPLPGSLFRSSDPVQLTESETEYVVKCIKHCFSDHLILQVT